MSEPIVPTACVVTPIRKTGFVEIHKEDLADLLQQRSRLLAALVTAEDALAVQASYRTPDQDRIERALVSVRAAIARARSVEEPVETSPEAVAEPIGHRR